MDLARIRNFSIIAHIDHGKSTLSDRILEITGAVDARDMRSQYLDSMDLERERGITIKAQNVRVDWKGYTLHLIDTPGHVDFGYEVSRSLAACEGVVLVVDAAQGIEAQTLANCYLALEHDLEIVAALNKIDLPAADPDRYAMEIETVLGIPAEDILRISAKTGEGVDVLLDAVCERIPAPKGDPDAPLQALIFDSQYDQYRGVVSSVRVMNGRLDSDVEAAVHAGRHAAGSDRDRRAPARRRRPSPNSGPARSATSSPASRTSARPARGETVTTFAPRRHRARSHGYRDPKPMVFCGLFPIDGDDFETAPREPREVEAQRRQHHLHARSRRARSASGSAAASSACCTWRSSRSASSASSTSPSSPPRRASSTGCTGPTATVELRRQPGRPAAAAEHRLHRGALLPGQHHHAEGLHRHADGAVPDAARRHDQARVPVARASRAALPDPARRGRRRLLRPDEEPHAGLRQPRLRAQRLPAQQPGARSTCCSTASPPTRSAPSCTATRPSPTATACARS